MVEAGHYSLAARRCAEDAEAIEVPGLGRWWGATSGTTRASFNRAADAVRRCRAAGQSARLGLMVGDLAIPGGTRPAAAAWALPESYRTILAANTLNDQDVDVWGEAACRNLGRRRLLDVARHRHASGPASYAAWGWALLHDGEGIRLVSDVSLDWEGDVRAAVLTRGVAALCPLVFAGLKEAIFRAGYARHVAIYALADDPWIDVKLRAAAAAVAQLRLGDVGEQVDELLAGERWRETRWLAADLVAPGERAWPDFLAAARCHHPSLCELSLMLQVGLSESPCPANPELPALPSAPACAGTKKTSRCSA